MRTATGLENQSAAISCRGSTPPLSVSIVSHSVRRTPFFAGYRPPFYVRTTDVTGAIASFTADDGMAIEMVMLGERVKMTVDLMQRIAIEQGMRFAIHEGDRTVGAGVVSKIQQ